MPRDTRPLPCCYPDGSCEEFVGDDLAALQQQCRDNGGCPGWWNYTCEDFDCGAAPVSCCDLTDGVCHSGYMWDNCITDLGGYPLCPEDCEEPQEIACEQMAAAEHVCCLDDYPFCRPMSYADCNLAGGMFLWGEDECTEFVCGVGCREAAYAEGGDPGPYIPSNGPEWGRKRYTTDTCYSVPMALVDPLPEHGLDIPPGYLVPATIGEVRNVARAGDDDPCAVAYGVPAFDIDGYLRPYLCSRLDHSTPGSEAYSEGVFCTSPDNAGVVGRGYLYARAAVLAQPPREMQYHHPQLICGGVE